MILGSGPLANFPRHVIGPLEFVTAEVDSAAAGVLELSLSGEGHHVHLLNAFSIALADKDVAYAACLQGGSVNFPDGKPLEWTSLLRRDPVPLRQIRGVELFLRTFERGLPQGARHFLLGSTPETLRLLELNLRAKFPSVQIVGTESPPYRPLTEAEYREQDDRIRESGADIVWVGLGTPKQDVESARLAASLSVTAVSVGAAFDFVAGTVAMAPEWTSRMGLEWLYRMSREPRRLWRRYVFGNARFLMVAARSVYRRRTPTTRMPS